MLEGLIGFLSLISLSITFAYFNGKANRRLGEERARREMEEASNEGLSRGIKKILGLRHTRSVLVGNWRRRLHEAKEESLDSVVSDSKRGGD